MNVIMAGLTQRHESLSYVLATEGLFIALILMPRPGNQVMPGREGHLPGT